MNCSHSSFGFLSSFFVHTYRRFWFTDIPGYDKHVIKKNVLGLSNFSRHYMYLYVLTTDLDHSGNGMNSVQVFNEALYQICYTQSNSPVSVAFQSDHLIGTAGNQHKYTESYNSIFCGGDLNDKL